MSVPTEGEEFAKLLHHLGESQNSCAMLSHLAKANDEDLRAKGWMAVSELLKRMQYQVTEMAKRKLQ